MNVFEGNRRMSVSRRSAIGGTLALLGVAVAVTLGTWLVNRSEPEPGPEAGSQAAQLGPHDGRDLSGLDTGRVAIGDVAPDFSLMTYAGTVTTLSDYRGEKNVVLVFYRGYW
jgi:hypothetical protein